MSNSRWSYLMLVLGLALTVGLAACSTAENAAQQIATPGVTQPESAAQQITTGKQVYTSSCASCHGQKLEGVSAPALGQSNLAGYGTAAGLYQYISTRMPANNPGSLNQTQYYQVEAYILNTDGLLPSGEPLTAANAGSISLSQAGGTTAAPATGSPVAAPPAGTAFPSAQASPVGVSPSAGASPVAGVSPSAGVTSLVSPGVAALAYNPPSLQDAPADIRDAVLLGYNIMSDTQKYAGAYVGNALNCRNCHFNAGLTQDGKNGGLSLVGVAATYPKYRSNTQYAEDLASRVNDCFERSMNGQPLPLGSKELTSILTYYQWIAKGIPIYADVPWLGLQPLNSSHTPDAGAGQQVFSSQCTSCHGQNGQGTSAAPPLWGPESYNDGAGMAKQETLAAFAYLNMPRNNPDLTMDQALNVAAYVDGQSRPHFVPPTPMPGTTLIPGTTLMPGTTLTPGTTPMTGTTPTPGSTPE